MGLLHRRTLGAVFATAVALGTVGLTGVASAQSSPPSGAPAALALLDHLRIGGVQDVTDYESYNWSGYVDDNSEGNTYSSVSASWVEPTVTCPSKAEQIAVFWTGIDGFNDDTVEQNGTAAVCLKGKAYYADWWEMYPTNAVQAVYRMSAGDHVTSTTSFSDGTYTLAVTDSTHPADSFTTTQTCQSGLDCANSSAEWIAERPSGAAGNGGYYVLPDFHTWTATSASVTSAGDTGVISSFPDDQLTMINTSDKQLAVPTALGENGSAFRVAWKASE